MSVKVVHIGLKARRRSINKEWGICTRWEEGIIKGRCRGSVIDATDVIKRPKKNSEMAKAGRKRDIQ
ncbi:hypothetical protein AGMMS50233_02910 [Endomicrobiia bacterium]|nr:hypothetical protein AGMMS50233_02910 [Endomicrobiia bacterium]